MSQLTIPEHRPGESRRDPASPPVLMAHLLLRLVAFGIFFSLTFWLWPVYWIGCLAFGRPPNVVRAAQVRHYLVMIWTRQPPPPGLPLRNRLWLTWCVVYKIAVTPVWGLAWLLDEALYGRALDATPIVAPLIQISAARSGSTQLARYLEEDPHIVSPSLAQFIFPYLWMWKLAASTIGRLYTREQIVEKVEGGMPPEFLQRHETNIFQTDTFEGIFYISHLNHMCGFLGPQAMIEEFSFARPTAANQRLWDNEFVALFDRIGRKTLLYAGPAADGAPRRLFIKGHFLAAADALAARFPDARFLTTIREPAKRLQSCLNFVRANPAEMLLGYMPWVWLAPAGLHTETDYCELEQAWFTKDDDLTKCVVRFQDYVRDLEGTMKKVYKECLDIERLPPHVPLEHPPRNRTHYLLNRSLEDLGIDADALNERLAPYIAWCRGEG